MNHPDISLAPPRPNPGRRVEHSIIIPVYRSGPWLDELAGRIHAAMTPVSDSFELILVNDASPDEVTWPAVERLARENEWIVGIDMVYNAGQFAATLCGFTHASGDYVLTMDDDLQHPPEELPKLVDAMQRHPDMHCIMGTFGDKRHAAWRNWGSRLFGGILSRAYGKPPDLRTTSFRIMKRDLAEALVSYRAARPLLGAMTLRLTKRIMNVPVDHQPRPHGRSGYDLTRLIAHLVDSLIYKSTVPLRLFSLLGLVTALVAFAFGLVVFIRWWIGQITEPGYASLILTMAFFSGMILMGIGVVGEYIARIIAEVSGPARYRVRQISGTEARTTAKQHIATQSSL